MSTPCKHNHPLDREGVSQDQRVLDALLPRFAPVDERAFPDLILFAKRYAGFLRYYNKNNQAEGDWKPFMLMDVSVTLATLIRLPVHEFQTYTKDIYDKIAATPVSDESGLKDGFKTLFDLCFSITQLLEDYYNTLPEDFDFREVLGNDVRSHLPEYLDRLTRYYTEAVSEGLIDPGSRFLFDDRPRELIFSQDFRDADLSDIWTAPAPGPPPFTATFNGATTALKIKNTTTHNLFTGITDQYLKTLSRVAEAAPVYLDRTLGDFPGHSPHYALFLAFIKLFRISQTELNTFTERHLDLYYRDILRLRKKDPVPDTVHLLFELSKTAGTGVLLDKDTVFKAGKDRDGQELFYRLREPTLLGKGTVVALKNTFASTQGGVRRLSAGTVANSGDGLGGPLLHADQSWLAFGASEREAAQTGFGIASEYLFLTEGERKIILTFEMEGGKVTIDETALSHLFTIELSAEKGWFQVPAAARVFTLSDDRKSFSVTITLDGGDPSIVPWTSDTHGRDFQQALPMALFTLVDGAAPEQFWKRRITAVTLTVDVEGIRNISVENDDGPLNPAKPFDLFGPVPRAGSAFIVSCKELFMKTDRPSGTLTGSLSLTWDDHETLTDVFDVNPGLDIAYLEDSRWKEETLSPSRSLFGLSGSAPATRSELTFELPALDVEADYTPNVNYSARSKWGFLKLILGDELGHADYARELSESIEVTTTVDDDGNMATSVNMGDVKAPYTPRVKEITLDYHVTTTLELSRPAPPAAGNFFHLTPFGHAGIPDWNFPCSLLPPFREEGSLFIGLDQLRPGQTLPLLIQVAEGTADPLAEKQEVVWHYLGADNRWELFQKEDIADGTDGLLKSGIVKLSIPSGALRSGSLMGEDLHWLKASVMANTAAVPRLLAISAQAAAAELYDLNRRGNFFKEPLPAGTISKLLVADPAIKKIEQPTASFGGRTLENDASWYRWISERLRHKQRAVSPWDYERLILEAFPDIYKVTCIPHARPGNELSPGHVMLVPIPDLRGRDAFDPLRPLVSLGKLGEIKRFITDLVSPHVELEVCNPLFEEIQLEFNVQYRSDDIDFFTKQLRAELEQFLAPWAFVTRNAPGSVHGVDGSAGGDGGSAMEFGATVTKSALINFIEERPYVDYISCVKMYRIAGGERSNDLEEARPTSSRSVFVSVKADDEHFAHIIHETVCAC